MKRHFDIRRYFYILVAITVVLYVLSTFIFNKQPLSAINVVAGLLFLVANAFIVYFTVDFFAVTINHAAPLVFGILTLSFPAVAIYDPSLWCALPANLAFYVAARFYGGDINDDLAFLYSALLGIASLLFAPLIWVAVFFLIMNFWMAGDKARFVVSSIAGFLLPLLVMIAVRLATGDARLILPAITDYLSNAVTLNVGLGASSAARVFKMATFLVCFIVSLVSFFRKAAQYSVSHSHVMIMILAYSAVITLLVVLFSYGAPAMSTMLIMVPVSLVIYDYLVWSSSDRGCRIAAAFLALAVLLEYIFR